MKMITGVSKMCCDGVIQYLEKEKVFILIDTFNKLGYKAKINTHTTSYIN